MAVAAMATTGIVNNFKNIPTRLKMAENQETVETVEEVALEATEQVEETVEETTEEVVAEAETTEEVEEEVAEQKEEGILAKVKAFLSNKLEDASNELQDRYAEVSNEVKDLKEAKADLESELLETRNVLEESYERMNELKASNEAKDLEIEELKNKLTEEVGEDLTPVVEPTRNEAESVRDIIAKIKNK